MNAVLKPLIPGSKVTEFSKPLSLLAPACPAGHTEYLHLMQGTNEVLVCHLEYEPAERGSREAGVQMEPDEPAHIALVAAYHRGGNIASVIGDFLTEEIEAMALKELT